MNVSIFSVFGMLIPSYRDRKFGCAYRIRNFSEPNGAILFYLNKLSKKKVRKKKEKRKGRKKNPILSSEILLNKKIKLKRAKNKVEHVSGNLFLGETLGYQASRLFFFKETKALPFL